MKLLAGFLLCLFVTTTCLADSEDTPNLQTTEAGLYRSGRPTLQGLIYMQKTLKLKSIIDLEAHPVAVMEESLSAKKLGIHFISMPMSSSAPPIDSEVNKIESLIKDVSLRPLLVHCLMGKDRTGLIIGLYRVETDGWSPQRAYNEMLEFGFHPLFLDLDKYFKDKTNMH